MNIKKICIFCSAQEVEEKFIKDTKQLGALMVENQFSLVWGGSNRGLMKVIADSVQENGGKIYGVTMELLRNSRRIKADEMIISKNLSERKKLLLSKSDAIILLVGGIGSLDEITEMLELKKHDLHKKPIVVLNTDKFYEGLKMQLQRMEKNGFLPKKLNELIFFANTPIEAINYINRSLNK